MPDYSKAVIYKIETCGQLYVGSTCNFTKRKYQHKCAINFKSRECNAKLYNTIRENGEWNMTPIKEFPCENKLQLTIEEEKCRKELGATLNSQCCGTGLSRTEYNKQLYENNKEKISEQSKQYREQNKEKIREKKKQYHQNNREKILERNKQKIECPICGSMITRTGMKRHQQTKKCKAHI